MGTESARATDGELLAHAEWVKRIAAALVGSAGEAEDLVQETWVAALRRPPAADRPLRPWLARVVRNFTFRARRSSARRFQIEREAARHEALPSSDAVAERLELERLLAEALGSLEEPYRSTVVLRYLDGRSAADIASEQGIPAGTVRWRLKVGLDELRSRLDRRYGGDRPAWSGVMFALAHPHGAPPAVPAARPGSSLSVLLPEVLAMNTLLKLACAAAIAVVAAVGFLALRPASGPKPETLGPVAAAPAVDPAASAAVAPDPDLLASERREVPAEPLPDTLAPAVAPADATPPTVVEARLIDDQGRPLHGELLLRGRADPAPSAADGRVRIEVALEQPTWTGPCEARSAGHASLFQYVTLERGRTTPLGELVLGPGGSASGLVLGPEGRPFAGAQVLVTGPGMDRTVESTRRRGPNTWPGVPSGRSEPDGTFRVEGVTPGAVRVWAGLPGLRYAMTPPLELGAGEELSGLVLELEQLQRDERIEGTVVDPAGAPVPGADISYTYEAGGSAEAGSIRSDEDGRFQLLLSAIAPHDLTARDPDGRWLDAARPEVPPGTLDLVLAFEEARWLDLRARDPRGDPVTRYAVEVRRPLDGRDVMGEVRIEALPEDEHPEGRARVRLPSERFEVRVLAEGFDLAVLGPFDASAAPPVLEAQLEPLPGIRGQVLSASGPVPGARVTAYECAGPRRSVEYDGFPALLLPGEAGSEPFAQTDAGGGFQLTLRASGRFALRVEAAGFAASEYGPFEYDRHLGLQDVQVLVSSGGALEGRVIPAGGRSPEGLIVGVNRGDLRPRTQRVGADGLFRFEGLTPGRWRVDLREREARGAGGASWGMSTGKKAAEFPWNCEVYEGHTTHFDLDLSQGAACVLRGRLLVDGRPAAAWTASLRPEERTAFTTPPAKIALDARGEFALDADIPGAYVIELEAQPETTPGLTLTQTVDLAQGEVTWQAELQTARVAGTSALGAAPLLFHIRCGSATAAATASPDAEGRFGPLTLPAGALEVLRLETDGAGKGTWKLCQQDELKPGGSLDLDLP